MKKMLQKLSSALLVVAVAGSCAFAQGQSDNYKPTNIKSAAVKVETESVKVQDSEREIYRAGDTSIKSAKAKHTESVNRTAVNKPSATGTVVSKPSAKTAKTATTTTSTTIAHPNATRIDLESSKSKQSAPASKKRVSNVHKAKPANYKAPSNGTKTKEK